VNRDWQADSASRLAGTQAWARQTMVRSRWRLESYVAAIFLGDRDWGAVRFGILATVVILFLLFGWFTESFIPRPWVEQASAGAGGALGSLVQPVLAFVDSLFTRQALRHAFFPILGILAALWVGARFVCDLFELEDYGLGRDYLAASLFGANYPKLSITSVDAPAQAANNPLIRIGGPGFVYIGVGLAALCEKVGGPADVLGTGQHFLRRFETLREVFDLRDQLRTVPELKAMTKDGILVTVRDLSMSFRVRTGNYRPRTEVDPYPFSISAVRRATYERVCGLNGPTPWVDMVAGAVAGQVRSMIARRRLDDLIGPNAADARAEMLADFNTPAARRKFAGMGADILWVSLGHFENPHAVAAQRIRTWQADWQRLAKVTAAEAQGERLRMEEEVRGEAVKQLIESIDRSTRFNIDSGMSTADQFFVLLAETLEAFARRSALTGRPAPEAAGLARELRQIPGGLGRASGTTLDAGSIEGLLLE
jgi:regulator of protease activity HflC (stomatin/prohibitin superfamily)